MEREEIHITDITKTMILILTLLLILMARVPGTI